MRKREIFERFAAMDAAAAERFAAIDAAAAERFAAIDAAMAARDRKMAEMLAGLRESLEEQIRLTQEQLRFTREEARITREVVRRNEIAFQDSGRVMSELVGEVRAQTQAIFALIDEIRGGGASPQAA